VLELELVLADLASIDSQMSRQRKAARANPALAGATVAMEAAHGVLEAGVPLYRSDLDAETRAALVPLFLLTNKAMLAVVNVGEEQLGDVDALVSSIAAELGGSAEVLAASVQLEAEAAQLDPAERAELLEGLGLGEGALARVARAAYRLIGRQTFLTTGDKESRAWTCRVGAKAPECAGVIHSDLQRGFIRAEVVHWDELLAAGSWHAAKAANKIRLEGKDYEVVDGDVLEIRFNV
jgi:ribosome-binding ATPase YchF (GTP1/OBG family)